MLSYGATIAVRLRLAMVGVVLWSLSAGAVHGRGDGMVALSNGALVEWRVEEAGDGPALGLSVPAFARWTPSAFAEPAVLTMRSEGHAVVDAWQLAFYRAGDTAFARPLRRFRGDAASLGDPVEWDGRVESGPPLRPGETVVAVFEIRDVAGNIDRAPPQKMLVARYTMRAERRAIASVEAERARSLSAGEPMASRGIPVRGSVLTMTVTNWLDAEGPRASGIRFRRQGEAWTLRQSLPPGAHEVVIQSVRPIAGGVRAIPVGVVTATSPDAPPLRVRVKGTGRLAREAATDEAASSDGFTPEATVEGRAAISRPMTHRDGAADRLALALIDAGAPVTLATDGRRRMAFLAPRDGGWSAWPRTVPDRETDETAQRRVSLTMTVTGDRLTLPHTDVTPGSVYLALGGGGAPLEPERDYAVDEAEGRILLTPPALSRLSGARLYTSYTVPVFAPQIIAGAPIRDGTWAHEGTWAHPASTDDTVEPVEETWFGMLKRLLRRSFGMERAEAGPVPSAAPPR